MASPQWKSYQPPVNTDPAILAFQRSPAPGPHVGGTPPGGHSPQANGTTNGSTVREVGVVEKLLHSYGFVQCCDRQARLFFHFSEYAGNTEDMKVGDMVEFQMSLDRKTGKPIACALVQLDGQPFEIINDETVTGTVAQEAKHVNKRSSMSGLPLDGIGRVSYEQKGECFFLPFTVDDVDDNMKLKTGDQVTFHIATDKRNGNIRARKLRGLTGQPSPRPALASPEHRFTTAAQDRFNNSATQERFNNSLNHTPERFPVTTPERFNGNNSAERHQGVVCSMKETFGFIERADVVKEIFFHYSEYQGSIEELMLGDDVDFIITTRNGKEVATGIRRLPEGTVIFEDVGVDLRRGKVMKTLRGPHGRHATDPLAGRINYETLNGSRNGDGPRNTRTIEIPYGDKDQRGEYTLNTNDIVEFNVATDRRDKLERATNICLVEDTFKISVEKREQGTVSAVKDGFGFITCVEREGRMFFHFSEMLDPDKEIKPQDEVEFTVIQDPASATRQIATRIKHLAKGTIKADTVLPQKYNGVIEKEPSNPKLQGKGKEASPGIIMYDAGTTKQTITYSSKAVTGPTPKYGDKIEFQICESKRNNTKIAVSLKLMNRSSSNKQYGFVATLKDNFGFIETAEHDKEVFFHFSAFEGDASELDLGDEVEFTLAKKTNKFSGDNIRKVPKGTVAPEEVLPGVVDGKVMRCMRIINPDQEEYPGLVQVGFDEQGTKDTYTYGITSLADKRDFLQKGDVVKFQIALVKGTNKKRATNVAAVRKYEKARVDSIKGQFGFLNYEAEEGKKLFFHMTEVHDNVDLQAGDDVEFVVVQNQRNGKYSACSVRKTAQVERPRPERLISRMKSVGEECGPRVTCIRQPKGPDGTRGFSGPRVLRKVGQVY